MTVSDFDCRFGHAEMRREKIDQLSVGFAALRCLPHRSTELAGTLCDDFGLFGVGLDRHCNSQSHARDIAERTRGDQMRGRAAEALFRPLRREANDMSEDLRLLTRLLLPQLQKLLVGFQEIRR